MLLLLAVGCQRSAAPAPPPIGVEVATVVQKSVPIYGEWVGTLDGLVNADIKAEVSGYLLHQLYHDGDLVRKGQPLFEIDPRPFQAALAVAEGQLSQTRGQLAAAQGQFEQAQAVLAQARSQLGAAEAVKVQAQGQLMQARASVEQALANRHKTELDVQKYRPLAEKKAVTQQDLDNAVQLDLVAKAGITAAQAQVGSAQGAVASATAQIGTARAAIVSASAQVTTARSSIDTARGQVQAAQAQVDAAQVNLGFTRISAPIDGVVGNARVQVGNLVGPSSDPIATISTLNPIKAVFTIAEQEYLNSVKRSPKEQFGASGFELLLSDGSVYPHRGRFYSRDRSVSSNTGAIRITAVFPNPGNVLRPGQYARVRAVRYIDKNALLVPQRAVNEIQGAYQIAVMGADNKVSQRTVKVGARVGELWVIKKGVQVGDRVVAEGTMKIEENSTVDPRPYVASPAPSGKPASPAPSSPTPSGNPK